MGHALGTRGAGHPHPGKVGSQRDGILDRVLDRSVFFSFDRNGFYRHQKAFPREDLNVDMRGKNCLITGANSGLGFETAKELARRGARVWLLCRNQERGHAASEKIRNETGNPHVNLSVADVSDRESIFRFTAGFPEEELHVLVNNAGVLPDDRMETRDGLELTVATNLIGPFLLTRQLLGHLRRASESRVINVSSGGMYAQRLDLRDIHWKERKFDGVAAYAWTKRALIVLTEMWAEREKNTSLTFHSMHPGWADTPSVRSSLPRFWRIMKNRLRTPAEGADTIVWLALSHRVKNVNGAFWFDRAMVPTHLVPWTRERPDDRERLWQLCCELAGVSGDSSNTVRDEPAGDGTTLPGTGGRTEDPGCT